MQRPSPYLDSAIESTLALNLVRIWCSRMFFARAPFVPVKNTFVRLIHYILLDIQQLDGLLWHGGEVVVVSDCVLAELNLLQPHFDLSGICLDLRG
jgi:hypothetical protein